MRDTYSCSRGVQGEAKVDYFGESQRVRGTALFVMSRPESVRFDVLSPFGANLSTLTSNGKDFALLDVGSKQFFVGPARECNVERFLRVPVPPYALSDLLSGVAPVLVHEPAGITLAWEGGAYAIRIASRHGATERIELEPWPEDWSKPWNAQRVRVREVEVVQQGIQLYHAELSSFEWTHTAKPRVDPDGVDPDILPSGPRCDVQVPHVVRIVSEASAQDVLLVHKEFVQNPPLLPNLFRQTPPPGVRVRASTCR